jgi:uncharacterized protein YciI
VFVCLVSYLAPVDPDAEVTRAHEAYLMDLHERGRVLAFGPRVPWTGGVIVLRGDDEGAARQLLQTDPFAAAGLTSYHLIPFQAVAGG